MNHAEAHRIARILNGPTYDGQALNNLIDPLIDLVIDVDSKPSFGISSTLETPATSPYVADNCIHCHAAYGHKIFCPLLNRQTAEAIAAKAQWDEQYRTEVLEEVTNPSAADVIAAHGLGILLN